MNARASPVGAPDSNVREQTPATTETRVHVLFTILWTFPTVVYAWCLRLQLA